MVDGVPRQTNKTRESTVFLQHITDKLKINVFKDAGRKRNQRLGFIKAIAEVKKTKAQLEEPDKIFH